MTPTPEAFAEQLAREEALRDTTPATGICAVCGLPLAVGEFPCITTPRPHGRPTPSKGFEPHFDVALGRYVTGWGDVRQGMREQHLDFRDHPSPGTMSERKDRGEQRKRDEARRR